MSSPYHFLVVADTEADRATYSRVLLRKFPQSPITDASVASALLLATQAEHFSGAVINITGAGEAVRLVARLRSMNRKLPIIAVCAVDRSVDAFATGASRFLLGTEWLMIGTLMEEVMEIANRNERNRWSQLAQPPAEPAKKSPAA